MDGGFGTGRMVGGYTAAEARWAGHFCSLRGERRWWWLLLLLLIGFGKGAWILSEAWKVGLEADGIFG